MGRVTSARDLPGARVSDAEALWYDTGRWPSFVDGFGHVVRREGDWPRVGGRLVWDAPPGGRGRVVERVTAHEQRVTTVSEVEDERLRGVQAVTFGPIEGGARIGLSLDYALKDARLGRALGALTDVVFIRRALRDSLVRTLARFARELAADRELAG